MSLTSVAEAKASSNIILTDTNFKFAPSSSSKGRFFNPSRTTARLYRGTRALETLSVARPIMTDIPDAQKRPNPLPVTTGPGTAGGARVASTAADKSLPANASLVNVKKSKNQLMISSCSPTLDRLWRDQGQRGKDVKRHTQPVVH